MTRFTILLALFLSHSSSIFCQDTVFVQKHWFETPVRNIFTVDNSIFAKTGDGLYELDDSQWKKLDLEFKKTFVFYNDGFVETEFIPVNLSVNPGRFSHLIPQKGLNNCTVVSQSNRLFIAVGGSLFEYEIKSHYSVAYPGISIRSTFIDEHIKVVSTYSGIYVNDTLRPGFPPYSNGNVSKVREQYFLSTDELYKIHSEDSAELIKSGENIFAGHSRKLIEWNGKVYSLNTNSINVLDENYELAPVHKGFDYSDMISTDSALFFSTYEGNLFAFDGKNVALVSETGTRIRGLFAGDDWIYIASDAGVFKMPILEKIGLVKIFNKDFCVDIEQDRYKNLWIATENGMYLIPKGTEPPVPIVADVEFNRYGLTLFQDKIYAGSINGLYLFDIYEIEKTYLPVYRQKVADQKTLARKNLIRNLLLYGLPVLLIGAWAVRRIYFRKQIYIQPKTESYSLEKIKQDIIVYKIISVEGMADHYHTNTVQLNRRFKNLGTTPGKFLKKVKISWAKSLLSEGKPLEEVARIVGYSERLLKIELGLEA